MSKSVEGTSPNYLNLEASYESLFPLRETQNWVMWPNTTIREAGKRGPAVSGGREDIGGTPGQILLQLQTLSLRSTFQEKGCLDTFQNVD